MPKKWTDDAALVASVAENLFEALPIFPKRILHVDTLVHSYKMPFSQILILAILSSGELSIGQLSDSIGVAKPNVTPLVDSLRSNGLVERLRDPQDRRIVRVRLTDKGEELLGSIKASIAEQIVEWPGNFSRSEIKELNGALASMTRIVGQMEL